MKKLLQLALFFINLKDEIYFFFWRIFRKKTIQERLHNEIIKKFHSLSKNEHRALKQALYDRRILIQIQNIPRKKQWAHHNHSWIVKLRDEIDFLEELIEKFEN